VDARNALDGAGYPTNLEEGDLHRISGVLEEAYAHGTRSTYGTGLLAFHIFCDRKGISEEHRAPVDPTVLASFILTLAGTYGGSTIQNYVCGIKAWHTIHGVVWKVNNREVELLLTAGKKMAPQESRRKAKEPWTLGYLTSVCASLNRLEPRDAAVLACLTTAFWGTARLGEVTVLRLDGFDPVQHVKVSDVEPVVTDRNGLEETVICLPWTKSARERGEKIYWAEQRGVVDPLGALRNHLAVNAPPPQGHLFAYKHQEGWRLMMRTIFLARVAKAAKAGGLEKLPGHGIRVGSTLEYLLWGVPFNVVKAKGRWQSDAFRGYLRKHAQIMAPYMQAEPQAYDSFVRIAMPPVR
jgi:hypothetical protein